MKQLLCCWFFGQWAVNISLNRYFRINTKPTNWLFRWFSSFFSLLMNLLRYIWIEHDGFGADPYHIHTEKKKRLKSFQVFFLFKQTKLKQKTHKLYGYLPKKAKSRQNKWKGRKWNQKRNINPNESDVVGLFGPIFSFFFF